MAAAIVSTRSDATASRVILILFLITSDFIRQLCKYRMSLLYSCKITIY